MATGKWIVAMIAALVCMLGYLTLQQLRPASEIPVGQQLDSGYYFATTSPGPIACNRLDQIDSWERVTEDSTPAAVARFLESQRPTCRQLPAGMRVRVDERHGLTASRVCIRPQGWSRCMWTVREAIERE